MTTRPDSEGDRGTTSQPVSRRSELRSLVAYAAGRVTELEHAMSRLPHVDSHGYSDCPLAIAKELYGKKEKLEQQVADCIPTLTEILHVFSKEVERCQRNLDRIREDAGRIHSHETQDKYSQAGQAQELELRRAKDNRDAVYMVLKKAELVLKISRGRRMPDIKRGKEKGPADGNSNSRDVSGPEAAGPSKESVSGELDCMISLGPRGQR